MTQSLFILSFAFITPAFFAAGVLLASIPIIIHLLNRRRYKTISWAAMDFLLRAMKKNRRRVKFEQWILLAARCLVVLLVATALARPLGCRDSTLASMMGSRSGLHVFVIDNSYSMAYEADRPDARTQLDQAKRLAKEQIERLSAGGEAVAIVTASRPAAAVLSAPTYDLAAASGAVDKIEQSYGGTDLPGALKLAEQIGKHEKSQLHKTLYILTDGTRSAWQANDSDALSQTGRELSGIYKKIVSSNLAKPNQWNQAALSLRPGANLVTDKFNTDFLATVQGFGTGPDPAVQWKLDGATLPGGGTVKLSGEPRNLDQSSAVFQDGGPHVISVNLASQDRLKIDDQRWRVVNVANALKVLIVEGERGMGPMTGSGAFLALALAPPRENATGPGGKSDSYISPEVISDLELGNRVLTNYRCVILTAVGQVAAPVADQLALYVKQGGTLMILMGEPVVMQNYNDVLLSRGLLPGPLTKRVTAGAGQGGFGFDFNPRGNLNPLLKAFAGETNSGLETAQIFTYLQMDVRADAKAERVLNYLSSSSPRSHPVGATLASPSGRTEGDTSVAPTVTGGNAEDPAITVHPLGQGRVVVVTTSANAEWTSLPAKPAYVALMHELVSGTVNSGDSWMNLTVGEKLQVPASLKLTGAPTLVDSNQRQVVLDSVAGNGAVAYQSEPIEKPGVYHLATGTQTLPIAVNVPSDEADVRMVNNATIQKALGEIPMELEGDQLPADSAGAVAGEDYGWPLMLAALLLVGAECWMAMRFGHYRRHRT